MIGNTLQSFILDSDDVSNAEIDGNMSHCWLGFFFVDSGGVFKARNPNRATKGARPIDDSKQTRTDLPVDQRPAEEVQVSNVMMK